MIQNRAINIGLVGQLNSIVSPSETAAEEKVSLAFDLGVEQVLRELAKRELMLSKEQSAFGYEGVNITFNSLDDMCERLSSQVSEEHKQAFSNISEYITLLEDVCIEEGYIAGFLAGYKFLKGLH